MEKLSTESVSEKGPAFGSRPSENLGFSASSYRHSKKPACKPALHSGGAPAYRPAPLRHRRGADGFFWETYGTASLLNSYFVSISANSESIWFVNLSSAADTSSRVNSKLDAFFGSSPVYVILTFPFSPTSLAKAFLLSDFIDETSNFVVPPGSRTLMLVASPLPSTSTADMRLEELS